MIYVIAEVELVDGTRDQFVTHFQANVPNVLAEAGCLEYAPTIDLQTELTAQPPVRDNYVTVVEKWESLEALQAHLVAPHMLTYREKVKDLVVKATLRVLHAA
jgi:quinol monooxygenase YgiN